MDLLTTARRIKKFSKHDRKALSIAFSPRTLYIYYNPDGFVSKFASFFNMKKALPTFDVHKDRIEIINDIRMIEDTLKYFGRFIPKIQLKNVNGNAKYSEKIMKLINEYCSETLVSMEILFNDSELLNFNSLKYAIKPFKRVEYLSIGGNMPQTSDIPLMNETFPALKRLSLSTYSPNNEFINYHFPQLEQAHLYVLDIDYVDEFLDLNPQIKTIELAEATPVTLRKLAMKFPQLEELTIESTGAISDDEEKIHFNNVTTFTMNYAYKNTAKHLHFPALQQFNIDFNGDESNDWIDFVKNHKHLTRFNLKYSYLLDNSTFTALTAELPNLVEMSVIHTKRVGDLISANVIVEFLEKTEYLVKFVTNACSAEDRSVIQEKLANTWIIGQNGNQIILHKNVEIVNQKLESANL